MVKISLDGTERGYLAHVPRGYGGQALPVVVFFHGAGGTAAWAMDETGWDVKGDEAGFLAVLPEGLTRHPERPPAFISNPPYWTDALDSSLASGRAGQDLAFMEALLGDLPGRFNIDRARIYASGFSNGAAMAFRVGSEFADRFAALAPVAGYCLLRDPRPIRGVPTVFLIGADDPLVPLQGGKVRTPWGDVEARPPISESLRKWARAIGCAEEPSSHRSEVGIDWKLYGPGRDGARLETYIIAGLGHHWPGGKGQLTRRIAGQPSTRLKATDVIWEFFSSKTLRR